MEGRYSFNCSIPHLPSAESTKLNNSNSNSFSWGSSPISGKQRQRSSSITNLINLESGVDDGKNERSSSNDRKIDARIVADVQSKGLASRIVKYHENGNRNRLNRSMSAHNLLCKPGHFPAVTLKKAELPYRATRQNVSMTRIVPPEKSMFYGNTLSSLLRSTSVMGLQKSDEDISSENRPIIHPPPSGNDLAPTRSVLDVLKEISRKRINSDDSNTLETSKKNRIGSDILDAGNNISISNTSSANMIMGHCYKRQRDLNSPYKVDTSHGSKFQDSNKSPEQAKKRVCGYNNDITSSLSSSTKRKPTYENKKTLYTHNLTIPTYFESYEAQKVKMQKCHDNRNMYSETKLDNPTSLKCTDYNKNVTVSTMPSSMHHQFEPGALPQRSKSEPIQKHVGNGGTQSTNKPRLTLFNKNYDVINEGYDIDDENATNSDESNDCAGIHFVKPKKLTSGGLKNPSIERTQKSKLALMLSGLRGELYQGSDNDELDSVKDKEILKYDESKGQDSNNIEAVSGTSNTEKQPQNTAQTNIKANPPSKNTSPLVGLVLAPQSTAMHADKQKVDATRQLSTPTLEGFSCNNVPNSATLVSANTTDSNSLIVSSVSKTITTPSPLFPNLVSSDKPLGASCGLPKINFGASSQPNNAGAGSNVANSTSTVATKLLTFGSSNTTVTPSGNIGISTGNSSIVLAPNVSCNSTNIISSKADVAKTSSTSVALSTSFNLGSVSSTTTLPNSNTGKLEIKPVTSATTSFTFVASSSKPEIFSSSTCKTSSQFSFGSTTTTASNIQFSFAPSVTTNNVSAPLAANTFSFGSSSNRDNASVFGTSNVAPTASNTAHGVSSFTQTPKTQDPASTFSAPTTASNVFSSSNGAAETTLDGRSKNPTTNFGSASINNVTSPSVGFAFGTVSNKTPVAGGTFAFGNTGNATNSISSSVTSDNNSSDKRNATNIFGGGVAAPLAANTPSQFTSTGFSFGTSTNAVAQNSSTFNFNSAKVIPKSENATYTTTAAGFSFTDTTPSKSKEIAATKPFSFGLVGTSTPSQSSNNQKSSNIFAATDANKGSTPAFNFGANTTGNVQPNSAPNVTNNIFTLPPSSSATDPNKGSTPAFNFTANTTGNVQPNSAPNATNNIFSLPPSSSVDRPIRRATRRLQK